MVRIKHRYFLVNIIYPEPLSSPASSSFAVAPSPKQHLPPVVRFRRPTPDAVTLPLLLREIRNQIGQLYGDYGAGVTSSSLTIKYFSNATSTFILRCPRAHFRIVWAALALITHLKVDGKLLPGQQQRIGGGGAQGMECVMRVVRVSGTVKKVELEAVRRARAEIARAKQEEKGQAHQVRLVGKGAPSLVELLLHGPAEEDVGADGLGIEDEDGDEDEDSSE